MTALSDQFLLLDKMREAARIKHTDWAAKSGILWVRFLKIVVQGEPPTRTEIANLTRALNDLSGAQP